ncbi:MAG: secretin N-terminal domain-containing protein [Candidatus Gastranaerophilales bacterium]|nr:secretin N-terminal domain-containing protein [Candidatus Gastranaerophilales bacterium]
MPTYKIFSKIALSCYLAVTILAAPAFAISANVYPQSTAMVKPSVGQLDSANYSIPLLEGNVSITKSPKLVTISLRDSDVRQVLRMLADKAGMNIILHDSVSGNVTLDLVNVTLNKSFEYVMVMNDLNFWVDGNTLIVSSKSASKDIGFGQQEMRTFNIKYESATRIADFLNKTIYKLKDPSLANNEIAITNPSTNQIVIIGTKRDFDMAQKVIKELDKKQETVMYDVNHMAAGQMAGLVCHKVFGTPDIKSESADSDGKSGVKVACSSKDVNGGKVDGAFSGFDSNGFVVSYYPDLGKIGVSGATPEQLRLASRVIEDNDIKQKQAILEISVIELNANGQRTISPIWQVTAGTFSFGFSGDTSAIDFNSNANPNTAATTGTTGTTGSTAAAAASSLPFLVFGNTLELKNKLTYLMKQGKGRVLTNPKILVQNNVESTIDLTQDYVKNIKAQQSSTTYQPLVTQEVEIGQYGIQISVKPTITPDGYIYMDLSPSYSVPSGQTAANGGYITLLSERKLELKNIRLKDNETLIIGGLIQEHETKSSGKMPYLADIPIIGVAFRSSSRESDKSELIIIVTPKILNDDAPVQENI